MLCSVELTHNFVKASSQALVQVKVVIIADTPSDVKHLVLKSALLYGA
jgi:hypothetical protein